MDGQDLALRRARRRRRVGLGALLTAVALARLADAGHVIGLGHYKYDPGQLRPQLRISQQVDGLTFDVIGYPGDPAPGEVVDFLVMVDGEGGTAGPVAGTVHRVGLLGGRSRIVEWRSAEAGGRFRFSLPEEAEYEVAFAVADGLTRSSMLSFPLVVGKPGSPWAILGGFAGGLALFVAGVVAVGRVRARRAPPAGTA